MRDGERHLTCNNRVCVVAEDSPGDAALSPFRHGLRLAAYDGLVEACRGLASDAAERRRIAEAGYEALRHRPQATFLEAALEALAAL